MEAHFPDLKMTYTRNMSDQEVAYFRGRDDWMDGTSLITSMTFMPNMVEPFIRSAKTGNNLLLLDLTIAGASGPASPEALLTQIHAQVLFMMMLAQTLRPGISCIHGGIPDVLGIGGDLDYSDPGQPIINSAMARLNLWVTGFPSAQSGGSTSIVNDIPAAVEESERSRNTLRLYGVHILRHAMGAMGNLNYFSASAREMPDYIGSGTNMILWFHSTCLKIQMQCREFGKSQRKGVPKTRITPLAMWMPLPGGKKC